MTEIITYFSKFGIAQEHLTPFLELLEFKKLSKGATLLSRGQTDSYLSFLNGGLIRFYVVKDNYESTFDFIFPHSFYCHYDSYYSCKPTEFYSEALSDLEIYRISRDDLQSLFQTCEYAKDLTRISVERLLEKKVKRELSLLTESPEERYIKLIEEQPKLLRHVPQKYIAAYLGIVPETLSRIRARIS